MTDERAETGDQLRRWTADYRVRFDEAGPDGRLRVSGLLRYAQDLAAIHSAALGFDRGWYAERQLTWLARAATATVLAPISHGSTVTGTTQVTGGRRVWARRHTTFVDGEARPVARVDVDWVLLDARGVPTRIPTAFDVAFGTMSGALILGRVDPGAVPADAMERRLAVRPQELDPMDHANNAVYADWVDELAIAAGDNDATVAVPRMMRLDYARSAQLEDELIACTWRIGEGRRVTIRASDGVEILRATVGPPGPEDA